MGVKVRQWKGAWWVFVDHKRQRKAKRVGVGEAGKRAAEDVAKAYEVQLALGTFDFSRDTGLTFEAYARQWLDTYGRTLKLGTREKYAEVLRVHWFPALSYVKVADITRAQVKAVVVDKARGYTRGTVSYMVDVLRSCLHAAVEDGLMPTNPASRMGALVEKGRQARPVEVFAPGVLVFILNEVKRLDPGLYPVVFLLARTGLRLGEALALQVGDLDLDARHIHVQRTWGSRLGAHGALRFNTPKGRRARLVDMSKQLTATMKLHLADRVNPMEWVFPGRHPEAPMHPVTFLGRWTKLFESTGVTYRKPHTLRHTYASLLIQNGESLAYVRDQLGHASIKITVDTYGHLVPGANKAAVDRLDELTGRNLYATGSKRLRRLPQGGGS
jgi:integrase